MEIISGKIAGPQKTVIYGPEGIGKSTFASQFPSPLFIDTEGSTKHLDVRRLPNPNSWTMLMQEIDYVRTHPDLCGTLVIDTADWAENLCAEHICAQNKWSSIETPGYGKGYVVLQEEFGRMLNLLSQVIDQGINVVLTAHAQMRKFEQPDELGAYDRWELKLQKKTAPMVKEWADMLLFANYKTYVINVDGQGAAKGKNKAQGGQRVLYTSHHPAWDAKNRVGLAEELPFAFSAIAEHIPGGVPRAWAHDEPTAPIAAVQPAPSPVPPPAVEAPTNALEEAFEPASIGAVEPAKIMRPQGIPDSLWQLMETDQITAEEMRYAVYKQGYYPYETPVANYDPAFVQGVLIGAWTQVRDKARALRDEMPF
ncbi:MAG: ATP-binding protein [Christensenellales bacterium]